MHYRQAVEKAVAFIDTHIQEALSARQIADAVGYSVWHFCRVFAENKGLPLMEYVRIRRLSAARAALGSGRRIIDVALDYGYETPSGFAKMFKSTFGYSPSTYAARISAGCQTAAIRTGGMDLKPYFIQKEAFRVAGYGIQTEKAGRFTKDMAAYWAAYTDEENLEEKLYALLDPPMHGEFGVRATDAAGESVYLLAVLATESKRIPPDMLTVEIPKAEYAVFTTPPVDLTRPVSKPYDMLVDAVRDMWKYILELWLPASAYAFDESKIDFEFYDERCHIRPDATAEIYVPVVKRT